MNQLKILVKNVIITYIFFSSTVLFAQVNVIGKWKIVKYDLAATVGEKGDKVTQNVEEMYFYQFNSDKTFTANGWLNPFRGSINNNQMKGTYLIEDNEIKLIYKKDDENINSFFYYDIALKNDYLELIFDKNKVIKWYKDSKNPNDSFAKKLSQTMFSTLDCKIFLQKIE